MKILGIIVFILAIATGVLGSKAHDPKPIKYRADGFHVTEFRTTGGMECIVIWAVGGAVALHCK